MKEYKKFLFWIFFIGVTIRLIFLFLYGRFDNLQGDEYVYHNFAVSFLKGEGWVSEKFFDRMPLYPLFLAFIYKIFGINWLIVKLFQAFLSSFISIIIFFIGKEVFSKKVGKISALYSTIYFNLIWYTNFLYTEIIFTLFLSLSVYLVYRGVKENFNSKYLIFAGIFISLATLTRPLTIVMPIFVFLFFLIYFECKIWIAIKKFLYVLIPFVILYAPWVIRNYYVFHAFVPTMIESGYAFYFYNVAYPEGKMEGKGEYLKQSGGKNPVKNDKKFLKIAFSELKEKKIKYFVKLFIIKIGLFFYPFLPKYDLTFGFLLPFFVFWLFRSFRKLELDNVFLLLIFFMFLLQTFIFSGSPRFRLPFSPFYIIVSFKIIIDFFVDRFKDKAKIYLGLWGLLNLIIFLFADKIRFILKTMWSV